MPLSLSVYTRDEEQQYAVVFASRRGEGRAELPRVSETTLHTRVGIIDSGVRILFDTSDIRFLPAYSGANSAAAAATASALFVLPVSDSL